MQKSHDLVGFIYANVLFVFVVSMLGTLVASLIIAGGIGAYVAAGLLILAIVCVLFIWTKALNLRRAQRGGRLI